MNISNRLCLTGMMIILLSSIIFPVSALYDVQSSVVSTQVSQIEIIPDSGVVKCGYLVNGNANIREINVLPSDEVFISIPGIPKGKELQIVVDGDAAQELSASTVRIYDVVSPVVKVYISLTGGSGAVVTPPISGGESDMPETPSEPENPDTPGTDTPGSDEPGSDEPLIPILPPAGWVKNIAGFASLIAGFLLLFLLFFMRGNLVYRTLKKHAKEHGEKPDKEEKKRLKEIASAVVSRIKDDEKYPEWRKNSDVMKRLGVDICLLLDEMKYREAVPREALVTEILEKARGKINRHRL